MITFIARFRLWQWKENYETKRKETTTSPLIKPVVLPTMNSVDTPPDPLMPRSRMGHLCATRALKNAKFIRSVAPHVIPAKEPLDGYASIIPFEILRRFHRIKDEDLHGHLHLLEAAKKARAGSSPGALF